MDEASREAQTERLRAQLAELRVIECGYIDHFLHQSRDEHVSALMPKTPADEGDGFVICEFDRRWQPKIVTHDFSRRIMFEAKFSGIIYDSVYLDECRILRVE